MRLIFEASSVNCIMSPVGSRMNAMTGLVILSDIDRAAGTAVMIATDPSTPTFHPFYAAEARQRLRRHEHDDDGSALPPSWSPKDAASVL